jgi:hypothetical protein
LIATIVINWMRWGLKTNLSPKSNEGQFDLFSMIVVETWLACSKCKGEGMVEKQKTFYTLLAENS